MAMVTASDSSGTTNENDILQRMDDCRPFNDKNIYTTTSRDGWLE